MSKRVESELYYVTFEMFVADVRRMFANARTYNSPETIYYKCATRHVASTFSLQYFSSFTYSSYDLFCSLHPDILLQARIPLSKQSDIGPPVWSKDSVGLFNGHLFLKISIRQVNRDCCNPLQSHLPWFPTFSVIWGTFLSLQHSLLLFFYILSTFSTKCSICLMWLQGINIL